MKAKFLRVKVHSSYTSAKSVSLKNAPEGLSSLATFISLVGCRMAECEEILEISCLPFGLSSALMIVSMMMNGNLYT